MNTMLIAPPASEPVSLAEARGWLRVDTADEDAAISALIVAARMMVEAVTRRALVTQSWRLACDRWPFTRSEGARAERTRAGGLAMALPLAPVIAVDALRIYDVGGQPQLAPTSLWRLVGAPDKPRLVFAATPPQPGVAVGGIEIDVVAGYGAADDVPAPLRQAMRMLIAHWFEHRGDESGATSERMPKAVAALVAPYRRGRLA